MHPQQACKLLQIRGICWSEGLSFKGPLTGSRNGLLEVQQRQMQSLPVEVE